MKVKVPSAVALAIFASPVVSAQALDAYDSCLLQAVKHQDAGTSIADIRALCQTQRFAGMDDESHEQPDAVAQSNSHRLETRPQSQDVVTQRVKKERETEMSPFVMTAYRRNYILPVTYSDRINKDAYSEVDWADDLRKEEAEFQISLKVPLNYDDLLVEGDGLYFGITLKSFWQVYAQSISRPFRETNYRPELFYIAPTDWHPMDGQTWLGFGVEHESNGQRQDLSRSWNRVYTRMTFAKDNFAVSLQPWWRIPEDKKTSANDPDGDDNPDIEDYMGHFELSGAYKWNDYEFSFLGRENFSTHKGFAQLGMTFPIWGKVRGYAQYSAGYGASLIDYNQNQQRFGLGVAITDLL